MKKLAPSDAASVARIARMSAGAAAGLRVAESWCRNGGALPASWKLPPPVMMAASILMPVVTMRGAEILPALANDFDTAEALALAWIEGIVQ